jgi:hypothetical protein
MAKMDELRLLSILQTQEDDSAAFTWGALAQERQASMKEYFREPYGTEVEGWSSIVTSDVQDTVEWILPALLKIFTSTDQAVSFDPVQAEDVEGAAQATDTCNYVFYKQNDGFLTLYTAFKDALMVKNCAVMWRKEKKRVKNIIPVKGASPEMLAMVLQEAGEDAEIEAATPQQVPSMAMDAMGQPVQVMQTVYDARICKYEEKTTIKVEAFPPEELLIKRDWTSPMLGECPYVARILRVTLSDLHEMGFEDVTAADLGESDDTVPSADKSFRETRTDAIHKPQVESDDESLTEGFLRIEYALVDFDGDGVAERRCIYRLKDKILKNEEADDVPFATASPILNPHRWDGLSISETVSDLQKLRTELTRQMVNSAMLANNPRTKVLTDATGNPLANIDDLLESAPGRILRQRQPDAIQEHVTPWVGGQMFPMLEYIDYMREQRTGVSRSQQGIDANALRHDRTAAEVMQTANAAAARIELIARIFAETLVKPIFKGILRLLTDGEMEPIAFRLRNDFVKYDPNEWRDGYDMTINVGLGTGDKQQQAVLLQAIAQQQAQVGMSPIGKLMLKPKHIYNTLSKIVENAGFKNVGDFYEDPGEQPAPDPGPPPELMKAQAEGQVKLQLAQQTGQMEVQKKQADLQVQAANDARDADREERRMAMEHQLTLEKLAAEERKHQREMEYRVWETQFNNSVKIEVANIASQTKLADMATRTAEAEAAQDMNDGDEGAAQQ